MQQEVQQWINKSLTLKRSLAAWIEAVNSTDTEALAALYHPKARVFPTFGSLKVGTSEIKPYLEGTKLTNVELNYGTIRYNLEENLIEGEYTFLRAQKADVRAKFAFKFDSEGKILEHASAPLASQTWYLKSEVSVCTLLTAATVKSVLQEQEAAPEHHQLFNRIIRESSQQ